MNAGPSTCMCHRPTKATGVSTAAAIRLVANPFTSCKSVGCAIVGNTSILGNGHAGMLDRTGMATKAVQSIQGIRVVMTTMAMAAGMITGTTTAGIAGLATAMDTATGVTELRAFLRGPGATAA